MPAPLVPTPRRLLAPALAALAAFLCLAAPAARAASARYELSQSPTQISDYWTPQRMQAAQPLDLPQVAGSPTALPAHALRAHERGGQIPPSKGVANYDFEPGSEASFPQRVQGRVFVTIPGLGDGSCSGTVVSSRLHNVVFTAGHCVKYPGAQLSTNFIFVPGYRDGSEPFGEYPATTLLAPDQWIQSADDSFDVGIAEMASPLELTLGARGIAFNKPPRTSYKIFGYPALPNPPYNGERLVECDPSFFGLEEGASHPFSTIVYPCDMKQGSSGGGWIDPTGHIVSVVSHGYIDPQANGQLAGPYFGSAVKALYNKAGGSAECPPAQEAVAKARKEFKRARRASPGAKKRTLRQLHRAQSQRDAVC
jgi:hypothetical protein